MTFYAGGVPKVPGDINPKTLPAGDAFVFQCKRKEENSAKRYCGQTKEEKGDGRCARKGKQQDLPRKNTPKGSSKGKKR